MNKENQFSGLTHTHSDHKNKNKLSEIKDLLGGFVGDEITFNQFVDIMSKDNSLQFLNRNSLLLKRKKFFKGEDKRGRKSAKKICMSLDKFVGFLGTLAEDNSIFDLEKFKRAVVYCLDIGHFVKK